MVKNGVSSSESAQKYPRVPVTKAKCGIRARYPRAPVGALFLTIKKMSFSIRLYLDPVVTLIVSASAASCILVLQRFQVPRHAWNCLGFARHTCRTRTPSE